MSERDIAIMMLQVGAKYTTDAGTKMKVLAIAEGYAMVQNEGCYPDVLLVKDLVDWIEKSLIKNKTT